jgi:hypothetical protein
MSIVRTDPISTYPYPYAVKSERVAPWFNQPGGGIQYKLLNGKSVSDLIPEFLELLE